MKLCFCPDRLLNSKTHFSVQIYVKIRTNVLARNACRHGVTRDTTKLLEMISVVILTDLGEWNYL